MKLTAQESIDLLRILIESGDKRLSSRLESQLIETLETLDKVERDKTVQHAKAWLDRQRSILGNMEE